MTRARPTQRQAAMSNWTECLSRDLAGLVCEALRAAGITVTLTAARA